MVLALLLACTKPAPPEVALPRAENPRVNTPAPVSRSVALQALLDSVAATGDDAWETLAWLCDHVGARPAGSEGYRKATEWAEARLRAGGIATARREPVTEPVWIRGTERLTMTAPRVRELGVLGLGGTIGTTGVEAPVTVVHSFDELSENVRGHIVLYNVPMLEGDPPAVAHYATAVPYRGQGASRAARFGAVAVLVRSVTTRSLYTPHTGGMRYEDGVAPIPAAAVTVEDAAQIERLAASGTEVRVRLELGARREPDAASSNVVAEISGATLPKEVVLIGAHLDSWDVGCGAHDDGAGVVHVIEAMRAIAALGVPPARTIRAVLFANEEHGLSGGRAYFAAHGEEVHFVALESDLGGGRPLAYGVEGTAAQRERLASILAPIGLAVEPEGGGADISVLEPKGVPLVGLRVDDSHYFDVHHTHADTVDKVDPDALREGIGAVAAFAWQAANAP